MFYRIVGGLASICFSGYFFFDSFSRTPRNLYIYFSVLLLILGIYLIISAIISHSKQEHRRNDFRGNPPDTLLNLPLKDNKPASMKSNQAVNVIHEQDEESDEDDEDTHTLTFRVTGVSFKNEDGSDRQTILRMIKFDEEPYAASDGSITPEFVEYIYQGDQAFHVLLNGYVVGNVPAKLIPQISKALDSLFMKFTDVTIYGGGIADNGEQKNYGCSITIEYTDC